MHRTRRILAAAVATAVVAAAPAHGADGTQLVSGTTVDALAVAATPAPLTNFKPGATASTATPSAITITSTGSWSLSAADLTANAGRLGAATGTTCTGSAAQTANQLVVDTANGVTGVTHATGTHTIGGTPVTVATGSLGNEFDASYTLALGATEQLLSGCLYSTTVTWTVQ